MQDILKHCVKACICELKNPPFMNPFLHRNRMHANRKTYTRKEIVELILKNKIYSFSWEFLNEKAQEDNEKGPNRCWFPLKFAKLL